MQVVIFGAKKVKNMKLSFNKSVMPVLSSMK